MIEPSPQPNAPPQGIECIRGESHDQIAWSNWRGPTRREQQFGLIVVTIIWSCFLFLAIAGVIDDPAPNTFGIVCVTCILGSGELLLLAGLLQLLRREMVLIYDDHIEIWILAPLKKSCCRVSRDAVEAIHLEKRYDELSVSLWIRRTPQHWIRNYPYFADWLNDAGKLAVYQFLRERLEHRGWQIGWVCDLDATKS